MAVPKVLRRLLHLLNMEEEMRRRELESAQGELARFETAMKAAGQQERKGRQLITSGVLGEDLRDRLAGLEEVDAGIRRGSVLQKHIEMSTLLVEERRAEFLAKRVERRQAETLVEAAEAAEKVEVNRRTQQSLDEWYLIGRPNERSGTELEESEGLIRQSVEDSD